MPRILVVDDNIMNLTLAKDVLEMHGYDVETAENGELAIAQAMASPPDLILMDLRMPVMDGTTAMLQLHREEVTRHIPVVALTASAMKGERERLLARGFDGYIEKPIDLASFPGHVAAFIKRG